eukprot:2784605-Pyramimonas_sp.AAC.1
MTNRTNRQSGGERYDGDIQQAKCGPKNTKWPTVGSGHSKSIAGMEFSEIEEHEVAYSWLRALKMLPGNGVLGSRRARSGL